ncbi:MAG: YggS family pyridoxal phosphate-dependent enzyme [Anaerolineae bacterium]|nr:YggS family pyridoxal phosphate-dependent enzyme [Anaerolineae bacterium]
MTDMAANLQRVQERIASAAERVGRDPAEVILVAVSKTHPPETIRAAYELGLRHFGENRVEEAVGKIGELPQDITWHMVGHLQSRKAALAVKLFDIIHSVDSVKLARRLDRFCTEEGRTMPVLLEVNVSGETSKYGFPIADRAGLEAAIAEMLKLPQVRIEGLMTMAPIVPDPEDARPVFRGLRELRDELAHKFPQIEWRHLSMGMTDDFEVAIEEGATMVRIGRAIFGPRRI